MPDEVTLIPENRLWLWRIAAVALILVVSSTTLLLLRTGTGTGNHVQQVSSLSQMTEVLLSDGSLIALNKGSTISYPEQLRRRKREVTLSGEAFFEVASRNNAPFYVYVGGSTVQVVGTSFNIKEEKDRIILSVISGEVLFYESGEKERAIRLEAGKWAICHIDTGSFEEGALESDNFLFWRTNRLTYNDESLEIVFKELETSFNISIVIADSAILQDRVTTSCEGQHLKEILHELSFLHDLHYSRTSDTIYVYKRDP